ncbi:MAG: hypothetical protein J6O09_02940 [Lachnospiraceae bacterium]|nr:hypothetical protein [Lachnospiraceae bacterium]
MTKTLKIIAIIFILIFMISSYFLLKGHYERHMFDLNKISIRKTTDFGAVLCGCFENSDWRTLPLSENFRKTYKTKFDITEHAGRFVSYDVGSTRENGEDLIIIFYLKENLFDFDDSQSIRYNLYFKYKTTDDGLLDDVEFVRMEKRDPMSGRIVEN